MKNLFLTLTFVLMTTIVIVHSQKPKSPNPTVGLIEQGLVDKLCRRKYGDNIPAEYKKKPKTTVASKANSAKKPKLAQRLPQRASVSSRRARQAGSGAVKLFLCDEFKSKSFMELTTLYKKTLKRTGISTTQ